jgi:hypothetical protein
MVYLGIDQHKRQLTVNLRGEDGSVILKRQVSTQWEKVRAFFADLNEFRGRHTQFRVELCMVSPDVRFHDLDFPFAVSCPVCFGRFPFTP